MQQQVRIRSERQHLFAPNIHVGMAVELNYALQEQQVRQALQIMQKRHPLLTATIALDTDRVAWYQMNTAAPIELVFREDAALDGWQEWMRQEDARPFDWGKGPLLRVLVISQGANCVLAVQGHHLLGDGMSYLFLLRDMLFWLATGSERAVPASPMQNAGDIIEAGKLDPIESMIARKLNRDFASSGVHFTPEEGYALQKEYCSSMRPTMRFHIWQPEETQMLIRRCRKENVTVNEALLAALAAVRASSGVQSFKIGTSCDVRKDFLWDPGESMGNYVSAVSVARPYCPEQDVWENARELSSMLREKLQNPKTRLLFLSWMNAIDDSLADAMHFVPRQENPPTAACRLREFAFGADAGEGLGTSNLGRADVWFAGCPGVERLWFVPPLFSSSDLIVGIVTIADHMQVVLRYAQAKTSDAQADGWAEDAKALLLQ